MAYAPYTSNPVADAERYYDALDAEAEAIERKEIEVGKEIRDVLTKHIRMTARLTLPSVSFKLSRVSHVDAKDVISDEIAYGKPFDALMLVLQKSDCPHVAALREAIAESYIESNAADIAELSA